MSVIIVSRHPGAVAWLQATRPDLAGRVIASATPDDVRGNTVVGNIPLHLAALTHQVIAIEFSGTPPRGVEYTAEEMRAAGAYLTAYTVQRAPSQAPTGQPPRNVVGRSALQGFDD